MKGFSIQPLLPALKARVTALHQYDDRLYVGLATGTLQAYSYEPQPDGGLPSVKLLSSAVLGKKPLEQIGVLAVSKQLLVLADGVVTVYPIDAVSSAKGKIITQARNAHTFSIAIYDPSTAKGKRSQDGAAAAKGSSADVAVLVEMLIIGCRKKVVVFSGQKPGFKEAWELALPHSPRQLLLPSSASRSPSFPENVHLLYSPSSSAILSISPVAPFLSVADSTAAPPPPPLIGSGSSGEAAAGSGTHEGGSGLTGIGVGALTGLGGYVGLGSKAAIPLGCSISGGEVLIGRDDIGAFVSSDGSYTREHSLQWPTPPEAISFANPYIYSILPPTATSTSASSPLPSLSISLGPSLNPRGSLQLPAPSAGSLSYSNLITTSPSSSRTAADTVLPSAKLLFSSTPTDKALLVSEGSSIWALSTTSLEDHVDELVREGRVGDAISLVESVGEAGFSPSRRLPHLETLRAVTKFAKGEYQSAVDTFLIFNINPALVLSLYPAATISGRLHVPRDQWLEAFGAVSGAKLAPDAVKAGASEEGLTKGLLKSVTAAAGLSKRSSMDSMRTAAGTVGKDDKKAETGSINEKVPVLNDEEIPRAALEALMLYLSDRRQKLTGAINALPSPGLPAESSLTPLSALPSEELHHLPNLPFTELEPETLLRVAQVIYTGLLKVYLIARPVLVGSLCRIENWCDVEEVEELLKAQKKFSDLIDLYQGKKMHAKALKMLHELAMEEDDRLDRYPPTVRYLQKLGPTELSLILDTSNWVFKEDPTMALQIFTADEPEVDALPRKDVVAFLEDTHVPSCIAYLQHIIEDLKEVGADFHDKLAELLLAEAKASNADTSYQRLLSFLSSSEHYRANRLLTRIPSNTMPEARALLLGRMGKHEDALRIYIYKLSDYTSAERYCSRVYSTDPDPKGIFLLLLRLYLRPSPSDPVLLSPALGLIASQGTRLDAKEVLEMLPPLVTMEDVRSFFVKTLRDGRKRRNEAKIVRGLVGARKEEVERCLMDLQENRVRITDQRICPQCHKRLGQSAIAVHAPRGEVTHLHCKDPFSGQLARIRG